MPDGARLWELRRRKTYSGVDSAGWLTALVCALIYETYTSYTVQIPVLLNIALCLIQTKVWWYTVVCLEYLCLVYSCVNTMVQEYEKVVSICDQVLSSCPGHVKALCRRGIASMYLHNFSQAR